MSAVLHLLITALLAVENFFFGAALVAPAGSTISQSRPVSAFDCLVLAADLDLHLLQSETPSLELHGAENILALVETRLESGCLYISFTSPSGYQADQPVLVELAIPSPTAITVSGAGQMTAAALATPELYLRVQGSGAIEVGDLTTTKLDTAVSGSGTISVAGRAAGLTQAVTGSGVLDLSRLQISAAGNTP